MYVGRFYLHFVTCKVVFVWISVLHFAYNYFLIEDVNLEIDVKVTVFNVNFEINRQLDTQ